MNDKMQWPAWLTRAWFPLILAHTFILQSIILLLRVATTYRALELGLDAFWIGVIGGAFGVLPALLGLHLGKLIDHGGEMTPLRVGSAMVLAACMSFWLMGNSLTNLLLCSVLLGLGQFTCVASQHGAIARCAPDDRRDVFFARLTVAVSLSHAVGPILIGLFGHGDLVPNTNEIFLTGSCAALALAITTGFVRLPPFALGQERTGVWKTARLLIKGPGFGLSVLSGLIIFAAMDLLVIYLPLYGVERGIPAGIIGTLLALRAVASILSRLMFGRLIALLGRGRLLVLAMLVAGTGIGLLPVTDRSSLMALEMILAGLGLGIGAPLTLAWVTEISPHGMRATALSLRLATNRVGQVILPVGVGAVVAGIGASGVLLATALTLGVTALMTAHQFRLWKS